MTMVQHALTLSPAATVGVDALRWIARRHRTVIIMPGTAAGTTGRWMHALALPDSHEALGLPPGAAAMLSADDILRAGPSVTLRRLIDRCASIRSDQAAWMVGIRDLYRSEYSPVATVRADSVSRVGAAAWIAMTHLTTDQSRRLIQLRAEHARKGIRILADHVACSIDCLIDAEHLLVAIMDCQSEAVTLAIDRRLILRVTPAGPASGTRAVYLLAAAPAAIAT